MKTYNDEFTEHSFNEPIDPRKMREVLKKFDAACDRNIQYMSEISRLRDCLGEFILLAQKCRSVIECDENESIELDFTLITKAKSFLNVRGVNGVERPSDKAEIVALDAIANFIWDPLEGMTSAMIVTHFQNIAKAALLAACPTDLIQPIKNK